MDNFDSTVFSRLVKKIEDERQNNRLRAVAQYSDLNFYHSAVAREVALGNCLTWLDEIKKDLTAQ